MRQKLYRFVTRKAGRGSAGSADLALPACVLFLFLLTSGCVRHVHVPFEPSRPDVRLASWRLADPALLAPRRPAPEMSFERLPAGELDYGWHDGYLVSKAKPCTGRVEPSAKVMLSRRPGAKRWVVILPVWGSSIYPPRQMARRLLRGPHAADTNVLWILGPDELFDWPAMERARSEEEYLATVERGARCVAASVRDVREYFDWIAARPDHDPRRLGLVGFSIGAIASSLVVAVDPRPDATVLVMGGGGLEHIFHTCRGEARQGRQAAVERFGWGRDEFLRRVGEPLSKVDPVTWLASGPAVDPQTIFFIDATKDRCIPEISRESLWQSLGRPEKLEVPYGHKISFLTMTFLGLHHSSHRMMDFLEQTLSPVPPVLAPHSEASGVQTGVQTTHQSPGSSHPGTSDREIP